MSKNTDTQMPADDVVYPLAIPRVAPFNLAVTPEMVQRVWDVYAKLSLEDDAPPQSDSLRVLMGILRAVGAALLGEPIHVPAESDEPAVAEASDAPTAADAGRELIVECIDDQVALAMRGTVHMTKSVRINGVRVAVSANGLGIRLNGTMLEITLTFLRRSRGGVGGGTHAGRTGPSGRLCPR